MAFNDFRKGRESSDAESSGVGSLTAFIDQGSEFSGKLAFKDTVRIDGRFDGEIESENTLIVGETGMVHANIRSEVVVVSGEVDGDILARRQLTVHKTGRVTGNVSTASLVVEDGSQLNGQVEMGPDVARDRDAGEKVVKIRENVS